MMRTPMSVTDIDAVTGLVARVDDVHRIGQRLHRTLRQHSIAVCPLGRTGTRKDRESSPEDHLHTRTPWDIIDRMLCEETVHERHS